MSALPALVRRAVLLGDEADVDGLREGLEGDLEARGAAGVVEALCVDGALRAVDLGAVRARLDLAQVVVTYLKSIRLF